jgi:hypothetical protein
MKGYKAYDEFTVKSKAEHCAAGLRKKGYGARIALSKWSQMYIVWYKVKE